MPTNRWARESIRLAEREGYLDAVSAVYPVADPVPRVIPEALAQEITRWHGQRSGRRLVEACLRLPKFPFDDIYVGYLKLNRDALASNLNTVDRLGRRLLSLGADEILTLARQPKVANRQMGELFHNWFQNSPFPKVEWDEFRDSDRVAGLGGRRSSIMVLSASRKEMKQFANEELDCALGKQPDMLVKVSGQYVLGEAKYLSAFGGHQARSVDDAVDKFLLSAEGDASRVAILDGVIWLDRETKECRKVRTVGSDMMSALLLPRYFQAIQEAS